MKFINYLVVRFSIITALGIVAGHFSVYPSFFILKITVGLALILFILWFIARNQLFQNVFYGMATYLTFFAIGYFNYQIQLPTFQYNHYSHIASVNTSELIQLKIIDVLKPDNYNHKYIAKVEALKGLSTTGKILLSIKKSNPEKAFTIDDQLLISAPLKAIPKPSNPNQFDYSNYMKTLGVYDQIHISNIHILNKLKGSSTLQGKAESFRNYLLEKLRQAPIELDERAIIQALVLGQKKDVSKELYSDYASAGAVHILAVSGLHVGILYFILSFLFSFTNHLKFGNCIKSGLLIICLWFFAFVTGLSPSVTRAVTMFSIFAFAKTINRQSSTINNLSLSFFLLILINPLWIFQVGFQLSYLAVFSILLVQPKLNNFYRPKFYIDRLLWGIFTVSIAAQLGVIPLSVYYFHQFPGLFFITNIVVLPIIGFLLGGGILILFLAVIELLPDQLAYSYNFLIKALNSFITWVANQDSFLFSDIHFSEGNLVCTYLLFAALFLIWKEFSYRKLIFVLICFSMSIGLFIWGRFEVSKNELIIFQKSRKTLIGYKRDNELVLFRSDSLIHFEKTYPIQAYRVGKGIKFYCEENIPKLFTYNDKTILVLDSLGVYPKLQKKAIVILTESPRINLERLIAVLNPEIIVADGSNYNSYVARWEKTCRQKKLPFHHTGTKGALIIE